MTNQLRPTIVVMAKPALPGQVMTRLNPSYSPEQAAAIHAALLRCVLTRVQTHCAGRRLLALANWNGGSGPLGCIADTITAARQAGWDIIDQGPGDLGDRLIHVWSAVGRGPIAFLGTDSPDAPADALGSLFDALGPADAGAGPTRDGGYWVLAARRPLHPLVRAIDWGTASVYDQTVAAAAETGVTFKTLAAWDDVDQPEDLIRLLNRLRHATEPPLVQLLEELKTIGGAKR